MLGGLRKRIAALEHDVAQAARDRELEPRWQHELAAARGQRAHVNHSTPLPAAGVDYSFARPDPEQLHRDGYTFAVRYLTGGGKALTTGEADRLCAAGLSIVSVFENAAEAMLGGKSAGQRDGRQALDAARHVGMPPHRPVYFACDFDIQPPDVAAALEYLHGAKEALDGRYFAGAYGGLRLVRATLNSHFTYAWQTLAWSGGEWEPRAQLRQTAIGNELDTDHAVAADYGQWRI